MEKKENEKAKLNLPTINQLLHKKNRLFLIGILGIFLIFLSDFLFTNQTDNNVQNNVPVYEQTVQQADIYIDSVEKELVQIIGNVQGVGEVSVMITLETPGQTIYAQSEKSTSQVNYGDDGAKDESTQYESEYTIINGENGDAPIVQMQTLPEIKGVAVVCEGGDDITVISRVTELVSVVMGVSTNRIFVTKMI